MFKCDRRRGVFKPIVTLLFLLFAVSAIALDPSRSLFQYNCRTWRRANGLPANAVNAIAQTDDGRLWLGTPKGLVDFDGVEFRVINLVEEGSMMDNIVNTLAARPGGGLWFGLERGSFGAFDGWQFVSMQGPDRGGASHKVNQVLASRDGSLLVASPWHTGRMIDTTNWMSLLPASQSDVCALCEDPQGRLWMGTAEHGLFFWREGQLNEFPDPTLRNLLITAVAVDRAGQIWVGTQQGLRCYDTSFNRVAIQNVLPEVRVLLLDRQGVLWIGTSGGGLVRCRNGVYDSFVKINGLANDRVISLAESRDGSLWVGTIDGLSQLSDVKFPTFSDTEGLVQEACLSVAASPDGGIWAATPNGISRYHDGRFSSYGLNAANGFNSWYVTRLFAARNGDLYFIDALKTLLRFRDGRVVTSWTNTIWPRSVTEDSTGVMVALGDRLMRIENDQLKPVQLADGRNVSAMWINHLLVSRDDSIWIAANDGVHQIKNGVQHNWSLENGLTNGSFSYLAEDDQGAVWATQSSGLARFRGGRMKILTRQEGLHEDFIYAIVADADGNFWMDSNRGIFRVSQRELNAVADGKDARVHCKVYDGEHAVKTTDTLGRDYSGCRSLDGRIWFPSSKGIVMIDPAHVPANPQPPKVRIQHVRANGQVFDGADGAVVQPGNGDLEFHYAGLNYIAPLMVNYRYQLVGYDRDWIEAGSRHAAYYTNLRPGRYHFQVVACNEDGVWSDAGAGFAVELRPHFHQTVWFRILAVLSGMAALAGLYIWRLRRLTQKQQQLQQARDLLEARVKERTAELTKEIEERKQMQREIESIHQQLVDASRQAGRAEVASGVLHNVGNVLNSVNVSAQTAASRIRTLDLSTLPKIAKLIKEHSDDLGQFFAESEKGRRLPQFMEDLARHLEVERESVLNEINELTDNVNHIKEIVAMQQSYAKAAGLTEPMSPTELLDNCVRMDSAGYQRGRIQIVREYEEVPPLVMDKHKAMQILLNILRNARRACEDSGQVDKRVTLRIQRTEDNSLSIAVADNGVGIPAENLARIFSHGFTTRQNGHGFGLHSSLAAAREMGGALTARSDGEGKGATFILELPLKPEK